MIEGRLLEVTLARVFAEDDAVEVVEVFVARTTLPVTPVLSISLLMFWLRFPGVGWVESQSGSRVPSAPPPARSSTSKTSTISRGSYPASSM